MEKMNVCPFCGGYENEVAFYEEGDWLVCPDCETRFIPADWLEGPALVDTLPFARVKRSETVDAAALANGLVADLSALGRPYTKVVLQRDEAGQQMIVKVCY